MNKWYIKPPQSVSLDHRSCELSPTVIGSVIFIMNTLSVMHTVSSWFHIFFAFVVTKIFSTSPTLNTVPRISLMIDYIVHRTIEYSVVKQ